MKGRGEAMMKAILGSDIQKGDAVLVAHNELTTITSLVMPSPIDRRRVYGLLHRPWPEGKTEQDMLRDIDAAIKDLCLWPGRADPTSDLTALREAPEAYELGKSETS